MQKKIQINFKIMNSNFSNEKVIVLGDFSENHTSIMQDAMQEFHWGNSQCTLKTPMFYTIRIAQIMN